MIKRLLRRLVEKLTGRKCSRCCHNCGGHCCHPNGKMFMRCWHSITLPGFKKRPPRYLRAESKPGKGSPVAAPAEMPRPAPLTPEQQYQLEKIKAKLQEAEYMARESGLLTED
jgi:hypothetical protein